MMLRAGRLALRKRRPGLRWWTDTALGTVAAGVPVPIGDAFDDNEGVVRAAVKKDGCALQRVSERLRADKSFVLKAVEQNGLALEYASALLRDNEEVVGAAVRSFWGALRFASERLRADESLVLTAVEQDGTALYYA
eukprot:Rhum_TRINITY_DN15323_c0_g6::Rhum_TRINITY_DN15323_c0_g6_i1::g.150785::m.150785